MTITKEDFIRISLAIKPDERLFNFKLKTKTQQGCFELNPGGNFNDIWKFLEDLCTKPESELTLQRENRLIAKNVDDENIRITLFCDRWFNHWWNVRKQVTQLDEEVKDGNIAKPAFDSIINKKHFIYTFYNVLLENYYDFEAKERSDERAKKDSEAIKKYLGYIEPKKIDLKLKKMLDEDPKIEEVERLLKEGANPNAVIDTDIDGYFETVVDNFISYYVDSSHTPLLSSLGYQEMTDTEKDKLEEEYAWHEKEQQQKEIEIWKVLHKYGALPKNIFHAIYGTGGIEMIKQMLDDGIYYGERNVSYTYYDAIDCDGKEKIYFKNCYNLYDEYLFEDSHVIVSNDKVIINRIQ